jgi:trehalose 6-phosphate phosphatase
VETEKNVVPLPAAAAPWALFLDVDGTLLDIASAPHLVVVPPTLLPVLRRLRDALDGALAFVTGRSLASLDVLMSGMDIDAAGSHGGEFRLGGKIMSQVYQETLFRPVGERLRASLETIPGVIVEVKPLSVAFHYRATRLESTEAHALVSAVTSHEEQPLRLLEGKKVIEVMPEGIGKGAAIARFMKQPPYHGRRPVFIGDDITDEDGFVEVNRMRGISIRVGNDRGTFARYTTPSVADVVQWLGGPVIQSLERQMEKIL